MQIDVQPFQVGEVRFVAISSPSPFAKSLVNKPDGTPLGGVARLFDAKTKVSTETVVDHLGANQFLTQNLREFKLSAEWVQKLGAYIVQIGSDDDKAAIATVVKYLRDNATGAEKATKKDTTPEITPALLKAREAHRKEMAAILGF